MRNGIPGQSTATANLPTLPDGTPVSDDEADDQRPRYNLFKDILLGVVFGARAADVLRSPGIVAWIATGFIPVVGTVAALRDARYAWKIHDWWSMLFNLLGLLPFVEGFATVAVLARLHRYHRVMHASHQVMHVAKRSRQLTTMGKRATNAAFVTGTAHAIGAVTIAGHGDSTDVERNRAAWPALILGLLALCALPVPISLALEANADSVELLGFLPFPLLIGVVVLGVLVSLAFVLFATHARRVSKRLRGSDEAHPVVSWLAVVVTRVGFLIVLGLSALTIYGERANFAQM